MPEPDITAAEGGLPVPDLFAEVAGEAVRQEVRRQLDDAAAALDAEPGSGQPVHVTQWDRMSVAIRESGDGFIFDIGHLSGQSTPAAGSGSQTVRLRSRDLLSKWGFNDGDSPGAWLDYCDENGIDSVPFPWPQVVHRFLLPLVEQDITVCHVGSHNPVRAETVDGVDVEHCWLEGAGPRLTPEYVDVRVADVAPMVIVRVTLEDQPAPAARPGPITAGPDPGSGQTDKDR